MIAIYEREHPCHRCGHQHDLHRTSDGTCTGELLDPTNGAYMRCNCEAYR